MMSPALEYTENARGKWCVPLAVRLMINKVRGSPNPVPILKDDEQSDPKGWLLLQKVLKVDKVELTHIPNNWLVGRTDHYGGGFAIIPADAKSEEWFTCEPLALEDGEVHGEVPGAESNRPEPATSKAAVVAEGATEVQQKASREEVSQSPSSSSAAPPAAVLVLQLSQRMKDMDDRLTRIHWAVQGLMNQVQRIESSLGLNWEEPNEEGSVKSPAKSEF